MPDAWFDKYRDLRFERRDNGVLWITINRPEVYNATDAQLHRDLSVIWHDIDADDDTRVVVITGEGKAFSAGGDLEWIESFVGESDELQQVMKEAGDVVYNMLSCSKVVISAINGVAVGAGLAVALMADISLMADDARITDGHVRMGVAAGDHAAIIWPLLCGVAKAKYHLLTAGFIDGAEADRIGLVSKAVPRDELLDEAQKVANMLATGSQSAIRLTKRSLNLWMEQAGPIFDASLGFEMLGFMGPDAAEGVAALRDKRPPNFG